MSRVLPSPTQSMLSSNVQAGVKYWSQDSTLLLRPSHAAKHVHVEIDRRSYIGQGRSKVNRKSLDSWCFPDSGAQVTLISPALVKALGGDGLVQRATLQIKGPTGHIMNTSGCIFMVISRGDELHTG